MRSAAARSKKRPRILGTRTGAPYSKPGIANEPARPETAVLFPVGRAHPVFFPARFSSGLQAVPILFLPHAPVDL